MQKKALEGIKVLDLSRVLAGPWCTMTLGDLGAEVWKIEHPQSGDDTRSWSPPSASGISTYYLSVNRNKKSVAVNLGTPSGLAVLHCLAEKADIIVENFRPSSLERMNFDIDEIRRANPRLIHCSITGYGKDNDYAERPGYDFVIQAESGFMSITGEPAGDPVRLGVAFVDVATGMNAVQSILTALYVRERTGKGQSIDIALWDSGLQMLANIASGFLNTEKDPGRFGNQHPSIVPYQAFSCSDASIVLTVGNDTQYKRLCMQVLQRPDLWVDTRFQTNSGRTTNREELIPKLSAAIRGMRAGVFLQRLAEADVPGGLVRTVAEAFASDEARARDVIVEAPHPVLGTVRMVRSPLRLSDTPTVPPTAPPELGENTYEVLERYLELTPQDLAELLAEGVISGSSAARAFD